MLAVPAVVGTGSEAQSYAVISDAATHAKMACGDPTAAFRAAILDPEVTLSQPAFVTATSGFDALAHAVETAVTSRRSAFSACFSREAWRLLSANYARVLTHPDDIEARGAMQLGAFHAGLAIEQSMLGAGHACANPLTASYDITHGVALALVLPQVVDWNAETCAPLYAELARTLAQAAPNGNAGERVADWLRTAAQTAGLPTRLRTEGVIETDLPRLADDAAQQWTGTFNPRPFTAAAALEIYRSTY